MAIIKRNDEYLIGRLFIGIPGILLGLFGLYSGFNLLSASAFILGLVAIFLQQVHVIDRDELAVTTFLGVGIPYKGLWLRLPIRWKTHSIRDTRSIILKGSGAPDSGLLDPDTSQKKIYLLGINRAERLWLTRIYSYDSALKQANELAEFLGLSQEEVVLPSPPEASSKKEYIDRMISQVGTAKTPGDRLDAVWALGNYVDSGSRVVESVIGALEDDSDQVRYAAVVVLGQSGNKKASKALPSLLNDVSARVRAAAAQVLGKTSGEQQSG
jgi:hypothetical protein